MTNIQDLEPQGLWKNFYALTRVPRPSGHLEKVQQFLLDWASERKIEAFKDNAGNIVMKKPATAGMENRSIVTIEAHMDMVPQKTAESTHDFMTEPIETYIDGDWVKARGTTLGSDDGIGVATAMAVFEDNTVKHGPLEAIFTVDEETCMYGVNHLKPDTLKGDILLNLDNETEGDMVIGSAGGMDIMADLQYREEPADADHVAVKVILKGLKGGHSGLEINEGRANANKLMARFVCDAVLQYNTTLASWKGGNMRNAIPNSCEVLLTLPEKQKEGLTALTEEWSKTFQDEFAGIEEGLSLHCEAAEMPENVVPSEIRDNMIDAVLACHSGVFRFIPSIPDVVETSCNLSIVTIAGGEAHTDVLARSSCDTMLDNLACSVRAAFSMAGMRVTFSGRYPAWQPNTQSPIVKEIVSVYKDLFAEDCRVNVVHAGLECSVIQSVYPRMDMISFGPTLRSPHTPNERCNIPSVAKYYRFVLAVLEHIPVKA